MATPPPITGSTSAQPNNMSPITPAPATAPTTASPPTVTDPPLPQPETTAQPPNNPLPPIDSPLPPPHLLTPRLHIRPMHPSDAPALAHYASPPSITRYMSLAFAHPYTLQHAQTWIHTNLSASPRLDNYVLTLHADPATAIGGIGIKPGSDVQAHTGELGYWIGEEFQGRGLMREAVRALCEWVFEGGEDGLGGRLNDGRVLRRLVANVVGGNGGSMRVLEGCGFVREGLLRGHVLKYGVEEDMVCFGLNRGEWVAAREKEKEAEKVVEGQEERKAE